MAGVSEYTVSVATASFRRMTLKAGKRDLKCLRILSYKYKLRINCVVLSKVYFIILVGAQPNLGRRDS
jgi:hypothetical protein